MAQHIGSVLGSHPAVPGLSLGPAWSVNGKTETMRSKPKSHIYVFIEQIINLPVYLYH